MGFGDKLKGLKDQAQQAVADNKDKIQGAVQVVGEAANTKTHGKYAAKIMKVGEKVEQSVDKLATTDGEDDTAAAAAAAAAPIVHEPANPVSATAADTASAGMPDFEPHADEPEPAAEFESPSEPVAASEPPAAPTTHSAPDFE